jgi:hypothetical protein
MFNHPGRAPAPYWQLNFSRIGDLAALFRKLIGRAENPAPLPAGRKLSLSTRPNPTAA